MTRIGVVLAAGVLVGVAGSAEAFNPQPVPPAFGMQGADLGQIVAAALTCVAGVPTTPAPPPAAHAVAGGPIAQHTASADVPPGIPGDWWTKVQQDIRQSEYHITWQEQSAIPDDSTSPGQALVAGYQAPNREHDFRTFFTTEGIRIVPRTTSDEGGDSSPWEWGLTLTTYGNTPVAQAQLSVSGNRIEYRRGDLTEWYVNDERGLEQGFTLSAPPRPAGSGQQSQVMLELDVSGNLAAARSEDGQTIEFSTPRGEPVVSYSGLRVIDATGGELSATMQMRDGLLTLVIDATAAAYPITVDPVMANANWSTESNQAGANYGWAVASAGDVNGDGYDDVIVGAPVYDSGQKDEGKVWVYHGSASGLISPAAFRSESNQVGANYGWAVASAGDVDADGFSDVVVGAPYYDKGQTNEGRIWIYRGSASGVISPAAHRAESNQANAWFGWAVAAGDFDGSGHDDVVIGAPGPSGTGTGKVWIYYDSSNSPVFLTEGYNNGDQAGFDVAAGDFNADGFDDVVVAIPRYDSGQADEGRVEVFDGGPGGPIFTSWATDGNQTGAYYGYAVATADVNGDGPDDLIVGAPSYDTGQTDEGAVWVYHGAKPSGLNSSAAFTSSSKQVGGYYGAAVATAGDVNADGYEDVIIAASLYDNGQTDEGQVWVYHGSFFGLIGVATFSSEGDQAFAGYGHTVATAGDVNGDGLDDVIIGAPGWDNPQSAEGKVEVYHGPL